MLNSAIGQPKPSVPPLDRNVFPVTRSWAYCNHAAVGPLPQPTRDAVVAALDAHARDGSAGMSDVEATQHAARAEVARAIGAEPEDVAFMRSTSDGALVIANGLDWRPGDEVILSDDEFGANAYPWINLVGRGVRTVFVRAPQERLTIETLERLVTRRTRLVAVSHVGFLDGYRHDIVQLGAWCRARRVLFAVDAMQAFGYLPLDVGAWNIDACYFGAAKWLLSPHGLSVVYVRRELVDRLAPALCSWRSVSDPMRFLDYGQTLREGAQRFDGATLNYPAIVGFLESLRLIARAGPRNIEGHVLGLTDRLVSGARRAAIAVKSDPDPRTRSGITLLDLGRFTTQELERRALASKVQVTIRDSGLRVSPHGYNTDDEIDRVLDLLT